MTRRLTKADREIWDRLRETVRPLRKRKAAKARRSCRAARRCSQPKARKRQSATRHGHPPPRHRSRRRPPSGARAVRGKDAAPAWRAGWSRSTPSIDLHGMRQERADAALVVFPPPRAGARRPHRARRHRQGQGGRRGARRAPPGRFRAGSRGRILRELVVGFEEAGRRHGGEGALYVRIRRRRATRLPASAPLTA